MQMIHKHIKGYSLVRKAKIKIKINSVIHVFGQEEKKIDNNQCWQRYGETSTSYHVDGNVNFDPVS